MREVAGRTLVVTGGGSGIGRATAIAFAARGARVVVADRDGERATRVAREIGDLGGDARGLAVDVARDDDVDALRVATHDAFGPPDLVMSNVGVLSIGRPEVIPIAEWARVLDVNFLAAVRLVHAFLPGMLERRAGHFVFTASTAGLLAYNADRLPYTTSKAALVALAEGLALHARPHGVGVTCLCPGPVATNIIEQVTVSGEPLPIRAPDLALLDPADVAEMVVEAVVADRFLCLTHPEVGTQLVRRARDPEAHLAEQLAQIVGNPD